MPWLLLMLEQLLLQPLPGQGLHPTLLHYMRSLLLDVAPASHWLAAPAVLLMLWMMQMRLAHCLLLAMLCI